jgi:crotonobetainyl-CoA:carnitine CoA-transferase CaiB-like acyl-CoA transferase
MMRRPSPVSGDGGSEAEGQEGALTGLRVVEVGGAAGEYCGLLFAGLGADVVKVEPPGGSESRRRAPFVDDVPDGERSLYFWHYNRGKRSLCLDLNEVEGRGVLTDLLATADVLIDSTHDGVDRDLPSKDLQGRFPQLVAARLTPFGDEGPWAHYKGSDLVHLALGGPVMNCGYDPRPDGTYDLPPIAPALGHSFHIAGEMLALGILVALHERGVSGIAQRVSCSIHEAVAKATEIDLMSWVMRRAHVYRQTCRHARETVSPGRTIGPTKDGRWILTMGSARPKGIQDLADFLRPLGMQADLDDETYRSGVKLTAASIPGTSADTERSTHATEVMHRFISKYLYEDVPWRRAQEAGLMWAPARKPHENVMDDHWQARGTFGEIVHPTLGRPVTYPVSRWISSAPAWTCGRSAPSLNENDGEVREEIRSALQTRPRVGPGAAGAVHAQATSRWGAPFALRSVRILDFTWYLASAGATRFLSAFGAESIKVEWHEHPDTRVGAMAPVGGRAARRRATAPLPPVEDSDMGGQFNNKNAGKRGISLNVKHPRGLEIAKELVRISDIVAEGFSPGVMDRWGLGYEDLRALKPDIIYAQQSGMGATGTYGRTRAVGPVAAALAGVTEMSGLPDPVPPAGWGYSYLDWIGAYSFASAMTAALLHRQRTGEGQRIDASQCEAGIFLTGVPVLDWSVNNRPWHRVGNQSPYGGAAPHGIYPCRGEDRWIAIACETEEDWRSLCSVVGPEGLLADPRFATLLDRVTNSHALDAALSTATASFDRYELMARLQEVGVAAGVCQTAEDRCDHDPQLAANEWLTEVTGTKIGTWPVAEVPVKLSRTPPFIGGRVDRGAPTYGEDNEYVYGEILGLSTAEIGRLAASGVI